MSRQSAAARCLPRTVTDDPALVAVLSEHRKELFEKLLAALAASVRFEIDATQLKKGHYYPVAHKTALMEQEAIKKHLLELLEGSRVISVSVTNAAQGAEQKW